VALLPICYINDIDYTTKNKIQQNILLLFSIFCDIIRGGGDFVNLKNEDYAKIRDVECFLLDMDGTIYLGDTLIDGTVDFLRILKQQNKKAIYITNNSSKATIQYVEKLAQLGIESGEEDFFTSVNALLYHLNKKHRGATLFLPGTPVLEEYLCENGFKIVKEYYPEPGKRPDYVILAFDTTLTYDKLRIACDYITDGVEYWATHPDLVCPVSPGRSVPDAGSFMNCIEGATGKRPSFIVGKPNPCMIEVIMEKYGYDPKHVAVIGDRLNTDILSAVNAGVQSICVLTGEAKMGDIQNTPEEQKPTYVFHSIKDVYHILQG